MKKVLSYVAIFLFGVLVTYGVVSFSGEFGLGKIGRDLPVKEVKEIGPTVMDLKPVACVKDNCDLYEKLELLHDELGQSSWTLQSMVMELAGKSDSLSDFLRDQLGYSTWTLSSIVQHLESSDRRTHFDILDKLGFSTWTLDSMLVEIDSTIERESNWIRNDIQDYCL